MYLEVLFWKIQHIQIQIYPQTYIEPKYGAFYLKNKVSAYGLVLLVQLSLKVAPPCIQDALLYCLCTGGLTSTCVQEAQL